MARAASSLSLPVSTPEPAVVKLDARKGGMHKNAVELLRDLILSGEVSPGSRLREVVLSQRFGMSRTPIREAFRTLAAEGFVELLPNRSVVVSDLNAEETTDVFLVLGALEALAAQQACQRITPAQIDMLKRLQGDLERYFEISDRPQYTQANRSIHQLMVEASNNPSLIAAWRMVVPRAERARTMNNMDRARWASSLDSHRKIFTALIARDGHLLSSLMQAHFAHSIIAGMVHEAGDGPAEGRQA